MTYRTKKNASISPSTSKVRYLTMEEVEEQMLEQQKQNHEDKVLMKCDQYGCEMELDAWILGEMAEADRSGELTCICMECSRGTMHKVDNK